MKRAVIDVGTNSIKCSIAEMNREGILFPLMDKACIVRLGEGCSKTGRLSKEAMERNCKAIVEYVRMVKKRGVKELSIVGTMALRTAENADEFLSMVQKESGIRMEILTGEEEAYYSYMAVYAGLPGLEGRLLIFNTGGGSTEFIMGSGEEIDESFSLSLGAVSLSDIFFLGDLIFKKNIEEASSFIQEILQYKRISKVQDVLVGMGGTVTTMGAVMKEMDTIDSSIIHGLVLTRLEVERQIDLYTEKGVEERKKIKGLHPRRADVILGGACIVREIMETYGAERLIISDWGLRHGLLFKVFVQG